MKFILPDANGVYQEFTLREGDKGEVHIDVISKEEVDDILEANKAAQRGNRREIGKGTQTSMYQLGSISALKAHELMKKGVFWDDKALRRWFNDLDNYLWRTTGKVRGDRAVQSTQANPRPSQ